MNILITSVGRRAYLVDYFKEALNGEGEVFVSNSSEITPAFLSADHSVVSPLIYDKGYIPFLLSYCKENHIDALLSLFDVDLPILAQNREQFIEIGTKVVISPAEVIECCNDKWKTYKYLNSHGFDVPRTFSTLESAKELLENGSLDYPVVIKPRWGIGSMQIYIAESPDELLFFYNKARREVMKNYLKYESCADADNCILIQEMLKGTEYGLDVINDLNGNFVNVVCKKKYAMRAGETDCAITVDDPCLKSLGEKIGKTLGHYANLDVDVFMVDGKPYVLEMNARFGGGYPFSHLAGIHLPKAIVSWLKGETPDEDWLNVEIGVMGHKDITLVRLN